MSNSPNPSPNSTANPGLASSASGASTLSAAKRFRISPLIRLTLLSFYAALVLPLPFLARVTQSPVPPWLLVGGIGIGGMALYGGLSEQVWVDEDGIQVTYPRWLLLRRGWSLAWSEITALKPRSTGQGGLVYYFLTEAADRAYLLPMRVVGFARLVEIVQTKTDIDTQDVKPLAQPWMYLFLLGLTGLLLLVDGWTLWTAAHLGPNGL
ncbi:MAG: hypothetical protein AAFY78_00490 [Cyanobacteria bacterium J06648_16]